MTELKEYLKAKDIEYFLANTPQVTFEVTITSSVGLAKVHFIKIKDKVLAKKDGYFTVTVVWLVFSLFGCLPYMFENTIPAFADAFFLK